MACGAPSLDLWGLMYQQPTLALRALEFLGAADLARLAATSWGAIPLALDDQLWRTVCTLRFPATASTPPPDGNWRAELWRQRRNERYQRALSYGGVGRLQRSEPPIFERFSQYSTSDGGADDAALRVALARRCVLRAAASAVAAASTSGEELHRLSRQGSVSWSVLQRGAASTGDSSVQVSGE